MISVVEFCGMMGSGKTTLAKLVEARLSEKGINIDCLETPDDWFNQIGKISASPAGRLQIIKDYMDSVKIGLQALRLGLSLKPRGLTFINHARRLAGWHNHTRYLRQFPQDHIAIMDEGALHMTMPLTLNGVDYSAKQLEKLVELLAKEEHKLFVFVHVEPEVALQRIRKRAGLGKDEPSNIWRYKNANPAQEIEIMSQMAILFDRINRTIISKAAKRTFVVPSQTSLDARADSIAQFILVNLGK